VIGDLWNMGGDHQLQAAWIAWECRGNEKMREEIAPQLQGWSESLDLAVQRTAAHLGREWTVKMKRVEKSLPPMYSLELPADERSQDYEPPLGFSEYDEGLWTDDPYNWTWAFKLQLDLLSKACPFSTEKLRRRTSALMGQMGGRAAFGPEVARAAKALYRRLDLELPYSRPMAAAGLLAIRQTAGELALAGQLDLSRASFFLLETGAFNITGNTAPPEIRPDGVARAVIASFALISQSKEQWGGQASEEDATSDRVGDWVRVASVAGFERSHFQTLLRIDRLTTPFREGDDTSTLEHVWKTIPRGELVGRVVSIYEGAAPGGIIRVTQDIAGSIPRRSLSLCPIAAASIGLRPDLKNPFVFFDASGEIAARTLWWREGGFRVSPTDDALRGEGCALLVRPRHLKRLSGLTGVELRVSAWRTFSERRVTKAASVFHRRDKFAS
jgi:hypothetical protein